MKYQIYSLHNYRKMPQVDKLNDQDLRNIDVVGNVLPFKTNNYVIDELIDWDNFHDDPMFVLNFPQKMMLPPEDFSNMASALKNETNKIELKKIANQIREKLNPHPAGQSQNVPELEGIKLPGIQHKYEETMLFFPTQGQTCHAYCTFCFRWPQFTGMDDLRFAMNQVDYVIEYIKAHPEITDILFTGGDPMVMKASVLDNYISRILEADLPNLQNIRIGTKSLSFWPYRFLTDSDSDDILRIFEKVVKAGKSLALMAHFNHYRELETEAVGNAVARIRSTGAQIRTQSPVLNHINADSKVWSRMWTQQVRMGMIPYYMFVARDTGAQEYFGVSLARGWEIFREAYINVSGIARTVRGPSMSCTPGKVRIVGVSDIKGEKVFVCEFIQGRNKEWVGHPFFAKYDPRALWMDDLQPAFGQEEFFFEEDLARMMLE